MLAAYVSKERAVEAFKSMFGHLGRSTEQLLCDKQFRMELTPEEESLALVVEELI
jgi:hypothetical protein